MDWENDNGPYSRTEIHRVMLKDEARMMKYKNAICGNRHLFKQKTFDRLKLICFFRDKIVLDVGYGTGILSLFAAEAGAKHVIGVDSSEMIKKAKDIARINGYANKSIKRG